MSSVYMAHSYPLEVERAKREHWPVLLPVGTMEYHSHHCPFGTDALVAEGFAREIGKKRDCLILPTIYYGVSSYAVGGPEKSTINMDPDVLEAYVYNILKSLFRSGFNRNICILIRHQTEEFLPTALACMKAAKKLTFEYLEETRGIGWWGDKRNEGFYDNLSAEESPWNWIRVFNGARFPAESEYNRGDHAGRFECSHLEYLYPGSIKLERLDYSSDWFARTASEMSVEEGRRSIEHAVDAVLKALETGERFY